MHEFWTISTANRMYIILQSYANTTIGELGIRTFEVVVVVLELLPLSFGAHPWFFCTGGVPKYTSLSKISKLVENHSNIIFVLHLCEIAHR